MQGEASVKVPAALASRHELQRISTSVRNLIISISRSSWQLHEVCCVLHKDFVGILQVSDGIVLTYCAINEAGCLSLSRP